jgi:hypothetical protein
MHIGPLYVTPGSTLHNSPLKIDFQLLLKSQEQNNPTMLKRQTRTKHLSVLIFICIVMISRILM